MTPLLREDATVRGRTCASPVAPAGLPAAHVIPAQLGFSGKRQVAQGADAVVSEANGEASEPLRTFVSSWTCARRRAA